MRIIKSLVPILVLLMFSFYGYHQYPRLPQIILNAVIFFPVVLSILVLALSVYFSRSHVFFYVLLIVATNAVLGMGLAESRVSYAMLSGFMPVLVVLLSLLQDRGIVSVRAMPSHLVLAVSLMFSLLMVQLEPAWLMHVLFTDWLPAEPPVTATKS